MLKEKNIYKYQHVTWLLGYLIKSHQSCLESHRLTRNTAYLRGELEIPDSGFPWMKVGKKRGSSSPGHSDEGRVMEGWRVVGGQRQRDKLEMRGEK